MAWGTHLGRLMSADAIADALRDNATGPKKVQGDEAALEQHSLPDQIAAHRHVAASDAIDLPHRGMRFTVLRLPGPTG